MSDNPDIENRPPDAENRPPAREDQHQDLSRDTTSWIGSHFIRRKDEGVFKRFCRATSCNKVYGDKTSHRALHRHWQRKHDARVITMPTNYMFHDDKYNDSMIKMLIETQTEYSLADKPSFKTFAYEMNPTVQLVCSKTISCLIEEKRDSLLLQIKQSLASEDAIALTFDLWSPKKGASGYGCVTGHFIDSNWTLRSLILEFRLMPHPHNGASICEFIKNVISNMEIRDKVIAMTTDNGSNVVSAIKMLEQDLKLNERPRDLKFFQFRCLGHIIHLGVQQAMKCLKPLLIDARKFVSAIRSSSKRNEAFLRCQKSLIDMKDANFREEKPLELVDDIDSRWNSSYLMIRRLIRLKKPAQDIYLTMSDLRELNEIDWDCLEALAKLLEPLHSVTSKLSGEKYCTISLVSFLIPKVIEYLSKEFGNPIIQQAADDLRSKLQSYIEFIYQEIVLMAQILDPRYKCFGLNQESIDNGSEAIRHVLRRDPSISFDTTITSQDEPDFFDELYAPSNGDELQSYLMQPREDKNADILLSWKSKLAIYPKLAHLARQILPIQATSTASERTFSMAGQTRTEQRNRLHPENFRSNVLSKSWIQYLSSEGMPE